MLKANINKKKLNNVSDQKQANTLKKYQLANNIIIYKICTLYSKNLTVLWTNDVLWTNKTFFYFISIFNFSDV